MIEQAKNLLNSYYGYEKFRPGQKKAIKSILAGDDTVAIMPTGSGKSICYQIPAMLFSGVTIVISPLISLMKDQVDALREMDMPAVFINSAISRSELEKRLELVRREKYKLVYIAPERLESPRFYRLLAGLEISFLAIDEAHCVSQWGHDFRPSYLKIGEMIEQLYSRPVVGAFTATATPEVRRDIIEQLGLMDPEIFISGFDRENLTFSLRRGVDKDQFVLDYLEDNQEEAGIIYAATRKKVDAVYEMLVERGFEAGRYHAGLSDEERRVTQEKFIYDQIKVVVATNAFGMGIDKSNVRYVIHYNMPKNIESYYQEAGRAGRDGEPGECILLYAPGDKHVQKFLIEKTETSPLREQKQLQKLQEMVDYCHTTRCLRGYILTYFGDENAMERCDNCTNCSDDRELIDITVEAQKVLSCVYRMNQRRGITITAMVLAGSQNKKVLSNGFDSLSTYDIMSDYTIKEIKNLINMLVADGFLNLTEGKYPILKLNDRSYRVLKGEEKVYRRVEKEEHEISSDNELFEVLRELRKKIAAEEGMPPYIIFHDSTLREMSRILPMDEDSLADITGVGEYKLEKYGSRFIEAIKKYIKDKNISV